MTLSCSVKEIWDRISQRTILSFNLLLVSHSMKDCYTLNGREVKQTIEFCWIYCFYIIIQLQFIEIHSDQECLHAC